MSGTYTNGTNGTGASLVPNLPPGRELEVGHVMNVDVLPDPKEAYPATLALHADEPLDILTDVAPPIHVSTTFRYPRDPAQLVPATDRESFTPTEWVYSRCAAPSTTRLEALLTPLLHAPNPVLTYSSGLSAINAIVSFVNPKVISIGDGYHGSHGVLAIYQRLTKCKIVSLDCAAEELGVGDLIMLETPVNPTGEAFNIQAFAEKAHSRGAYLMVDSTFAPPPIQEPFSLGADIVMHSGTKYVGGHSDLLCGVVAVKRKEWIPIMLEDRVFLGSVMGGLEGWLAVRSVRTLELRVERQSRSAAEIVTWLDRALKNSTTSTSSTAAIDSDKTKAIIRNAVASIAPHASLQAQPDHPDSAWVTKQMPNPGMYSPVFSILTNTEEQARRLPSFLKYFHHATSLGGVESLIEWRCMSDSTCDRRLLRVSVGVEDVRDLMADLVRGFEGITSTSSKA